jgi:hypothetical protein
MATDKHATIHNHATVEAFSLGFVPVMTSSNSRGIEEVFSLGSVPDYITDGRVISGHEPQMGLETKTH